MTADYRLNLPPVTKDGADEAAARVLARAEAEVGFIPNMYANMANAPELLETYLDGYARFRERAGFTPPEQEVVFLTISRFNGCTYCMGAHSMLAAKVSQLDAASLQALRAGAPLPDPKLQALSTFTETMVATRGRPARADVQAFLAAGYGERHVLGVVLANAVKTLSNYANHLFHSELDDVFADFAWSGDGRDAA